MYVLLFMDVHLMSWDLIACLFCHVSTCAPVAHVALLSVRIEHPLSEHLIFGFDLNLACVGLRWQVQVVFSCYVNLMKYMFDSLTGLGLHWYWIDSVCNLCGPVLLQVVCSGVTPKV